MKYQIPVDGWYTDKISASSAEELKDSFGVGTEVIVRNFPAGEMAQKTADDMTYGHGVRALVFTDNSGSPAIAAEANSFSRLSYLYLPVIHIHSRNAA